jgi:hypothetical protein
MSSLYRRLLHRRCPDCGRMMDGSDIAVRPEGGPLSGLLKKNFKKEKAGFAARLAVNESPNQGNSHVK